MTIPLSEFQAQLETDGYCVVPRALPPELVQRALRYVQTYYEDPQNDPLDARAELQLGQDDVIWNLQNKDFCFSEILFASAPAQELQCLALNDEWYRPIPPDQPNYILHSFIARSSGTEPLRLHIDSLMPLPGRRTPMLSLLYCLEDQDIENGCTVIVPGSHLLGEFAPPEARDQAVPIPARAGDIIVMDSRAWHGAGPNRSHRSRWVAVATFARWFYKQNFNITQNLPQSVFERLTEAQKSVLGYCSIPPQDETERQAARQGYDSLCPSVSDYGAPAPHRRSE